MQVHDFTSFQTYLRTERVLERFGLQRIGVFGSFARGEAFQDIDLLIDEDMPYQQLIAFRETLQHDLQVSVDIMLKQYAEPIILHRAQKDLKYATRK